MCIRDRPEGLYGLDLRDLCGIGRAMGQRLERNGIRTVRDLCAAGKDELRHAWGSIEGERFYARLRGEEMPDLSSQRSSVSHSHVLPPELRTPLAAFSVLHRLLQKASMRLRSYACIAGAMRVKIKLRNHNNWENQAQFEPTSDTLKLLDVMENLLRAFPMKTSMQPVAVAIALSRLDQQGHQTRSLFDEGRPHDKLNQIIDSVSLRYGRNFLYFGGAHAALRSAPMRIAFGHIPDLTVEADE